MNSEKRILLSSIVGIMLAISMIGALSALTSLVQTETNIQAEEQPEDEEAKIGEAEGERALAEEAAPVEEQVFTTREEGGGRVFTMIEPVRLGAPFALALIVGLATFMIVRSRVG